MWARKPSAHFARLVQEVTIVSLKARQIDFVKPLTLKLRKDLVVPLEDVVDVAFKLAVKALELAGKHAGWRQSIVN